MGIIVTEIPLKREPVLFKLLKAEILPIARRLGLGIHSKPHKKVKLYRGEEQINLSE